jgi:hypothetical protein
MPIVQNKYRGSITYIRVLGELVQAAQYRGITTYQDIALIMGLPMQGSHMGSQTGQILGEIVEDEADAGRPMLSAVAVAVDGKPGSGFYELARKLARLNQAADEITFWKAERDAVYQTWRRPLPS